MRTRNKPVDTLVSACLILALGGSFFSLNGCARPSGEKDSMKAAPVATAQGAAALESQKEKLSYALGMVLGNQFREQSVEVDLDRYVQGLKDAQSGSQTLLTEAEARATISVLQRELKRKQTSPPVASTALTDIKVAFKLDSRLTRGMYMGDRWVSPPTFTQVGEGKEVTVEATAQGLDATGKPVKISPEWTPEDSGMVTVTPGQGDAVRITVQRAGQSQLKVVSSGVSTELQIKATYQGDTIQVEISQ
jgi:hypothetical protein